MYPVYSSTPSPSCNTNSSAIEINDLDYQNSQQQQLNNQNNASEPVKIPNMVILFSQYFDSYALRLFCFAHYTIK